MCLDSKAVSKGPVVALANAMVDTATELRLLVADSTQLPCSTFHRAIGALKQATEMSKERDEIVKSLTLLNRAATALDHFDGPKLQLLVSAVKDLLRTGVADTSAEKMEAGVEQFRSDMSSEVDSVMNCAVQAVSATLGVEVGVGDAEEWAPPPDPAAYATEVKLLAKIAFFEAKVEALLEVPEVTRTKCAECQTEPVVNNALDSMLPALGGLGVDSINTERALESVGRGATLPAQHRSTKLQLRNEEGILRSMAKAVDSNDYIAQRFEKLAASTHTQSVKDKYLMTVEFFKMTRGPIAPGPDVNKRIARYQAELRSVGNKGIWKACS